MFKWCSNNTIPKDLHEITDKLIGYSRIDDNPIYSVNFNCNISVLKLLFQDDNKNINIFSEVSKQLRYFKIQKIIEKSKGKEYVNKELEKFSIFLQHYYNEKGNINIVEQL